MIYMVKVNEDPRGLFVELVKGNIVDRVTDISWKPEQISYLTINPNYFRGHHYHLHTREAFILLEGDCNIILMNANKNKGIEIHLKPFECFEIGKEEEHTLISKKGAKLLVLSSKEFNPNDPDTFVYEDPRNSSDS